MYRVSCNKYKMTHFFIMISIIIVIIYSSIDIHLDVYQFHF